MPRQALGTHFCTSDEEIRFVVHQIEEVYERHSGAVALH